MDGTEEDIPQGISEIKELSQKIQNRGTGKWRNPNAIKSSEYKNPVPLDRRKHTRIRRDLTAPDKIQVVHQVVVRLQPQYQVARSFRISQPMVSSLVKKAKKNPRFLAELAS